MGLYAIGDFHLSFGSNKPMDVFGSRWADYEEKIAESFSGYTDDDTIVLCGDLSWAMNLEASLEDFKFIDALPGNKIILKGNHDYWWSTASKVYSFFAEHGISSISVLHNNFYEYGSYAICGSRGWFFEENRNNSHDKKIVLREAGRLETSLKQAGDREKIVFLHYPPIYRNYECTEITDVITRYNVRLCLYGHIHGNRFASAYNGWHDGTEYKLVSADYLNFNPLKIL